MKQVKHVKEIYNGHEGDNIYIADNELYVRDISIDARIGEDVYIGLLSDIHLNYCNDQDFDEADPVIMSTYENRVWCANGATVPKLQKCLEFLDDADQIVINGDTLDYLSHGTMELMQKEIWDKIPGVVATVGGHEISRKMQGKVEDTLSRDERIAIIEKYWKHDMYYMSKLLKNKVLVVGMFNDMAQFNDYQRDKLKADIESARKNGYAILIFAHEPIATHNPKHSNFTLDDVLLVGDSSGFPRDLCSGTDKLAGGKGSDDITKEVYSLITSNADVIKAVLTGHYHNDMYLEIIAKNADGSDAIIPQYVTTATAYQKGHATRITVK